MKRMLTLGLGCLVAVFFTACASLLNLTIPRDGYSITKNIAYGEDSRQHLDIYQPIEHAAGNPVILFFYGGRWETGSKDDYLFVGQALASKGITVVIADYRLYPKIRFPVFVEDAAKAAVWVHQNISSYGGDPQNLFVVGHSSGAYLAIMLATNDSYLKKAGGSASWLRGAIGISGPYDFLPFTDADIKDMFSTAPDAKTQPISFVHKGMPPMLLVTGQGDTTVYPKNSINFASKSKAMGNEVDLKLYPDVEHIGIIVSLANGFRDKAPLLDDIAAFATAHSR
jgi:acetyl esterase/lipase